MPSLLDDLTNAVFKCISELDYTIDPPKLSLELWDRINAPSPESKAENERLEFLGDSLLDACFSIELYRQIPYGTPHMYTEIRSALHRNMTFCHLANKLGIATNGHAKDIGDIFETIVGAYYTEKGFAALCEWTNRVYEPILLAAIEAFHKHCDIKDTLVGASRPSYSASQSLSEPSSSPTKGKGRHRLSNSTSTSYTGPSSPLHQRRLSTRAREPLFPVESPSPSPQPQNLPSDASLPALNTPDPLMFGVHTSNAEVTTRTNIQEDRIQPVRIDPDTRQNRASSPLFGIEDIPLPDFWEEVRNPDGTVYFVDHEHQVTTWHDPRLDVFTEDQNSDNDSDGTSAWTARLVASLPGIPQTPVSASLSPNTTRGQTQGAVTRVDHDETLHIFPDLLAEGYRVAPLSQDFSLSGSSLPDFWEVREGNGGRTYFIDHVASTISLQNQT